MCKTFLIATLALLVASPPTLSQQLSVTVQVHAILVDNDLNQKPVPHLVVRFSNLEERNASPIEVKTGFDGAASTQIKPGKYRLTSPEGVEFQGRRYTWDLEVAISGPNQTIELSNDNAKATQAPAPAPARQIDELTALFEKYQNSVVTVWSEIGHGTGFIVDSRGLIVTNQHVIGPSELISVQFDSKLKVEAKLLAFNPEKDVAILWANLSPFPKALVAPIAKTENNQPTVIEGERVFTIGSPLSQRKILTTGIVSKVEAQVIISDININPGNSGGPLFNSLGQVVGITTFGEHEGSGPGVAGIVRIEEISPVLDQARRKMGDITPPSPRLLPVEPADPYPLDSLKESIQAEKFNVKPYIFSEGDFDVALATPVLEYRMLEQGEIAAAREKGKRTRKNEGAVKNTFEPLQDLRGWAEYAGAYKPVLLIQAQPQLRETFWSAFGRSMAASGGRYAGPARMRFKTDFYRMKLLCGDKEVEPIQPGKVATVENVHNYFVNVTDATYVGLYSFPADAVSPSCSRVVLELYSEKEPDKPTVKTLDSKTVNRIWSDFQPYLTMHKKTAGEKRQSNN
jgi:S1-C subfamily serine protease